jgi:hypothetical protein
MSEKPALSIIVIITDGAPNLGRCLSALQAQENLPASEIIVPVHPCLDAVQDLGNLHPAVRFIPIDNLPFSRKPRDSGLRHIVYDHRRSAGLRAARGDIIAMTEDHAIPPPDWCSTIVKLHAEIPHGAIGGAIDNAGVTLLNWAAYFGEFIRYQNPVTEGPSEFISDVNISYKRAALEKIRTVWECYYHETTVHSALQAAGESLWLSPKPWLSHDRGALSFSSMCLERIGWARIYAGRRAQQGSLSTRLLLAAGTPLLPPLFLFRRWSKVLRDRRNRMPLLGATPLLVLLYSCWAFGEFLGYVTAHPTSRRSWRAIRTFQVTVRRKRLQAWAGVRQSFNWLAER